MKLKNTFNVLIAIIGIALLLLIFFKINNTEVMIKKEIEKFQQAKEKPPVILKNLKEGDYITSPLVIKGEAKGSWFNEGSFPVILTDGDGLIIAETQTTVNSNWLTDDHINFEAYLEFESPEYFKTNGHLIFQNANQAETLEESAYEIIVNFK
jgi:hypothetical protein